MKSKITLEKISIRRKMNIIGKVKIWQKIIFGFVVMIIILTGVSLISIRNTSSLISRYNKIERANEIYNQIRLMNLLQLSFVIERDLKYATEIQMKVLNLYAEIDKAIKSHSDPSDLQNLEQMKTQVEEFVSNFQKMVNADKEGKLTPEKFRAENEK